MRRIFLAALGLGLVGTPSILAQPSAFTYQGRLTDGGSPASGTYDLRFYIYDGSGAPVAGPLTNTAIAITNGLIAVTLDFGALVFNGPGDRFLDISVRTNGGGPFQTLSPRQQVTAAPYSVRAGSAVNYTGPIIDSQLSANIARLDANQSFGGTVNFNGTANLSSVGHVLNALPDLTNAMPNASLIWAAAPTPFLAYQTYFDYFDAGPSTSATNVLAVANRWLTNGMYAAGWRWMIISDGWEGGRETNGDLFPNPVKFPNGMADIVLTLHQLGYRVGLYTSMGTRLHITGFTQYGTDYAHFQQDIQLFARWGIDLLMVDTIGDNFNAGDAAAQIPRFRLFANSVLRSGRQIHLYVVVESGLGPPYNTGPVYWETPYEMNTMPINGTFDEFPGEVSNSVYAASWTLSNPITPNLGTFFGPGHYPHIGTLVPLATTYGQAQLQAFFSMAAMISASIDTGEPSLTTDLQYYTNAEVMAINQDSAAIMPSIVWSNSFAEVWSKPIGSLTSGSNAIVLANLRSTNFNVGVSWSQLGFDNAANFEVRDLWAHTTLGNFSGGFTNSIGAGTVGFYLLRKLSLDVLNLRASNGIIITSNNFPITSWPMLGNCGCITWMSNATCYLICTNSINGTASTNKLGGL